MIFDLLKQKINFLHNRNRSKKISTMNSVMDEFGGYFWRLQINTGTNLSVNFICIYLILTKSTPAMGYYKYYILFTVVAAMIMDFHISCIYGLYIPFPLPVSCSTGVARFTYSNYVNMVNYVRFPT